MTTEWAPGWWEIPGGAVKAGESSLEAVIIGGNRDIVLLKELLVDHKALRVSAYRKPVHSAVLVCKVLEVSIVDP